MTARSRGIAAALCMVAVVGCGPRSVEFDVVDPARRSTLSQQLHSEGAQFTTDDRGYIICTATFAKKCNDIYQRWQATQIK